MRRMTMLLVVLLLVLAAGCGPPRVKAKGRLVNNGEPYRVEETDIVHMAFTPTEGSAGHEGNYVAEFNRKDSTFQVLGKEGRGLPPGKYRITVQVNRNRKDILKGAFGADKSPFVQDITDAGSEIVLDVGKPKG
jgi:hypothetical protein